jgi:ribosome biogenesis GTPase
MNMSYTQAASETTITGSTCRGFVIRTQSGFYTVRVGDDLITCKLRGILKRGPRRGDVVAVGDRVEVLVLDDGSGIIESVEPRQRMLSRLAPNPQGAYHQIIIANPDQAVFVFSCTHPDPHYGMLDRFLVIAEKQSIPVVIVVNKSDLLGASAALGKFEQYLPLGYPVMVTSARTGLGVQALRQILSGKISVFAGPSGVGKSSLLNTLLPDLHLDAREVSTANLKGKHTTVVRELYPLEEGGYVADTPGLKALALWDIQPEELDGYFPELRQLVAQCGFSDCTHLHEPGCAVRAALEQGTIHPLRYASYARMRQGQEE